MKSLSVLAGMSIQQKQWENIKKKLVLPDVELIDKQRFQNKKKKVLEFPQLLEQIKNKNRRSYSRMSMLNRISKIYQDLFYESRVSLPEINQAIQLEFLARLSNDEKNEIFIIHSFYKHRDYTIYYLRTPMKVSQSRYYPPNKIIRIILFDDQIIDIFEFEPMIN